MSLSIRIYGGDTVNGMSATPLVSVGSVPEGFQPAPPTIVDEPQSYIIVHAKKYIYYGMFVKHHLTAPNGHPGQLLICLFMPAKIRLKVNDQNPKDTSTPLDVLTALSNRFIPDLVKGADGNSILPEQPVVDCTPYANQLMQPQFALEERSLLLPEMKGQEAASFKVSDQGQLKALMNNSRYNQLSKVGRLEVGFRCETTVQLPIQGAAKPKPAPVAAPVAEAAAPVAEAVTPLQQKEASKPEDSDYTDRKRSSLNGQVLGDPKKESKKIDGGAPGVDIFADDPRVRPDSIWPKLMKKAAPFILLLALVGAMMLPKMCSGKDKPMLADNQEVAAPDTIFSEDTMIVVDNKPEPVNEDKAEEKKPEQPVNDHRTDDADKKPANPTPPAPDPAKELRKQQRAEMLKHINQMDWQWVRSQEEACRKYMSQNERDAVEALYLYNPATGMPYNAAQREFIKGKIQSHQFSSIEQIVQFKSVLMLELSNM